jgi:phosphoribosylanthranilate isomerase
MAAIARAIHPPIHRIGVFLDPDWDTLDRYLTIADLSGVQLHGAEPPALVARLRAAFPHLIVIKALRISQPADLLLAAQYDVDYLLLDAYDPHRAGGTGQTIDWNWLRSFAPPVPWLLAGGLTPDNVATAVERLHPAGVDVSSGVESSPGIKDLDRVAQFLRVLRAVS